MALPFALLSAALPSVFSDGVSSAGPKYKTLLPASQIYLRMQTECQFMYTAVQRRRADFSKKSDL